MQHSERRRRLREVAQLFLWLGVIGVGGPAAHIAMIRRRVVQQRQWVSEDDFVRMVGACALVPGPNSTEMAMAIGARRAGWRGLLAGGAAFIAPAFVIVCVLSWVYEDLLTSETIADIRRWVVPIVAALVLDALWSLRTTALRDRRDVLVVALAVLGVVAGLPELLVLLMVGIAAILLRNTMMKGGVGVVGIAAVVIAPSLLKLFFVFLQIGSVIYGSGYVLLVFLDAEIVARGWITPEVLLDAISIGQFTPGPVFTTATFIGWQINGLSGAALATLGIFGPSFLFAALIERFMTWSRVSTSFAAFLCGVSSGSIALMGVVMWRLAGEAFVDAIAVGEFVFVLTLIQLLRYRQRMEQSR